MGGVRGGEEGHTQEHTHTEERTRECCTYPLATYPLKSARNLQKACWGGVLQEGEGTPEHRPCPLRVLEPLSFLEPSLEARYLLRAFRGIVPPPLFFKNLEGVAPEEGTKTRKGISSKNCV